MSKKVSKQQQQASLVQKTDSELITELNSFKKELFNLRFQSVLGDLKNTGRFKQVRKNIARMNTEISSRKNKQSKGQ